MPKQETILYSILKANNFKISYTSTTSDGLGSHWVDVLSSQSLGRLSTQKLNLIQMQTCIYNKI